MATRLDIHTHTCNHYNFFCFFLSYLSLSPAKDYRAASNVCFLWWECLFIEASVVESKGTPMQRQAKPVWIYLYWAWPTSAVRANTWLHPCVRLRGWGGGGAMYKTRWTKSERCWECGDRDIWLSVWLRATGISHLCHWGIQAETKVCSLSVCGCCLFL